MTDIIKLAREAGLCMANDEWPLMKRFAELVAAQEREAQVLLPEDAQEIRLFVGSNFISRTDGEPSDNDRYVLSAHDLLSCFRDWVDFVDMDELKAQRDAARAKEQTP